MECPKVLGPTILTGTSEIDLGGSGVRLESPINGSILSIKVEMANAGVMTTKEALTAVIRLKSNTIPVTPYECLAQPINAGTGAEVTPFKENGIWYPVNAQVHVGDKLQITAMEDVANTVHPYVCVTVLFADYTAYPAYHSQIGTVTACGAAAQEYTMTTPITIDGGKWIKAIYGEVWEVTGASGKGCIYKYRLSSNSFKHQGVQGLPDLPGMGDIEFGGQFIPGYLSAGTTADAVADRLTELKFPTGYPINSHTVINCYCNAAVAFNASSYFNIAILYT